MNKNLLLTSALLVGALAWAAPASAGTVSIGLQEAGTNGGLITLEATGAGSATLAATSYGTFTLNQATAQDTIGLGGLPGILHSNALDTSSGGTGVLHVWVTSQNLTGPAALADFISTFTANSLSGLVTSVSEETFIDPGNGLFDLGTSIPLSSASFVGPSGSPQTSGPDDVLATAGALFSVTHEYTITATGVGNANLTIDLDASPVPEPASLALLGVGLIGLGWRRLARRKTA